MFDPMISPKEITAAHWEIDEIATNVSGREVPTAIMVAPIIRGEIFILPENFSINLRRRLAETIRNISENENVKSRFCI